MRDKTRNDIYIEIVNYIDEEYELMTEYDSIAHMYNGVKLYQSEIKILHYIGSHEGTTITAIAAEMGKTASAYSQVIRKLKQKEIVRQIRNEKNAREYNLYLTSLGKRIFKSEEAFEKFCNSQTFEKLDDFTKEELETFCRIQKKLNEAFSINVEESYKTLAE